MMLHIEKLVRLYLKYNSKKEKYKGDQKKNEGTIL